MQLHKEQVEDEKLIKLIANELFDQSKSKKILIGGSFAYYYARDGLYDAMSKSGDIDVYSQFSNTRPFSIAEFDRPNARTGRNTLSAQVICMNPAYKHLRVFNNYFKPEKNLEGFDQQDREHCAETMKWYAMFQDLSDKEYKLDQLKVDFVVEKLLYLYDIANYNNMLLLERAADESIAVTEYTFGSPSEEELAFNDRQIAWFEYLKYRYEDPSEDPNDLVLYIHLAIVSKRILSKASLLRTKVAPQSRCYIESLLPMCSKQGLPTTKAMLMFEGSSFRAKRSTVGALNAEITQLLRG
jgi:hypothetical protein